ncbi:TrkA family potassium uptake protein [Ruminococcaceae bacterium OttesenSCG-928-A16]|nr:TrkA family potassium uptake protein [Ruminococcaceae bacterium OttesenSCG-928-A16]
MRICIIGGGKVGFYLAKTLLEHNHEPIVIEQDAATCTKVANELDVAVIHGNGASVGTLEAADCANCQAMVCVSGKDEVNLVAAQLGKKVFNIKKTIARVNNPKNTEVLKALGIDIVLSSTINIARLIEHQVETTALRNLLSMGNGTASLVEILVPEHFRYNGKTLRDIPTPKECVVVSIMQNGEFSIPTADSVIYSGDQIMAISSNDALHELIADWKIGEK